MWPYVMQHDGYMEVVMEFSYYLPVNLKFGWQMVDRIGELTKPYGKKVLIVTGRSSAKRSGLYDRVVDALHQVGVESVLFDKVQANPLTTTAEEGARLATEEECDVVIALGGGSIMDCAKGIAFLAVNEGNINDYIYNRLRSDKALPLVVVPTTCGTGSEGNGFGVLTNPENGDKKSLRCSAIVPKVSIVDPACMQTMPRSVLASVGFDALCHLIEAYTAKSASPITDAFAYQGLSLWANHFVSVYQGEDIKEGWEAITLASTFGGMVINNAGVTLAHGMEHPASGLKDITHGKGLAAIEPVCVDASWQGNPEKFAHIAKLFGATHGGDVGDVLRQVLEKIDLRLSLSDLGIAFEDIPWMVENCLKVGAGNIANNPVMVTGDDIRKLYQQAL